MFSQKIKIILIYLISFTATVFLINQIYFPELLRTKNFLNWDGEHYHWIKQFGYKDFRVAFFPLFPMLWKFLHLNVYGAILLNISTFLISLYFLSRKLKLNTSELLLYLSIPSFCFFFLPYTEAIFFACSTLLLIGLKDSKLPLVLIGLFLCTLTRPAFTVFIPALVLMELFYGKFNLQSTYKIVTYIFVTLIGVLTVGLIQHHYTGEWFKFFEAQKGWGNHLQIPTLPLNSWGGGLILRLDGTALVIGLISGIFVLAKILKLSFLKTIDLPKEVFFSLCYLAGITVSVLLFRGGLLFSLNRFVFATPFIIIVADFYIRQSITFKTKQLIACFITLFAFWLILGSYLHITALISFLALTVYLFTILLLKNKNQLIPTIAIWSLISLNFIFQVILLIKFLNKEWVG